MNILIITSRYCPSADANGICSKNIALELKKRGHRVKIIALHYDNLITEEKIDDILILKIPFKKMKDKKNLYDYFKRFVFWPYISYFFLIKVVYNTLKFKYLDDIEIVIPVIKPNDHLKIAYFFKKLKPNIKVIPYILDSLDSELNFADNFKFFNFRNFKIRRMKKLKEQTNKISEKIIKMKYDSTEDKILGLKTKYFDIPLLENRNFNLEKIKEANEINIVYAGTLSEEYRDPRIFFEVLDELKIEKKIKLEIYGKNNFINSYISLKNKKDFIINKGEINHNEILEKYKKANFLLSIGNKGTKQVPSKIFEYMSLGKPIIHFYFEENDSSLEYLRKYPYTIFLKANEEIEKLKEELENKLTSFDTKLVKYEEIKKKLIENTPIPFVEYLESLERCDV